MGKSFSYEDAVGQTASNGAFSYEDAISETPKPQNKGVIGDTVTDLKRGVEQLPGALTGLTDLVNPLTYLTGTRMADTAANWLGEKTGFQPSKWQEEAASEYSPERKASDEAISKAWEEGGAANIAGAIATNPRSILGVVGQSAPSMVAGGGAARLAMKGLASIGGTELAALTKAAQVEGAAGNAARETLNRMATTAGAIGEGAVTAGQNMDQVSRDVDPAKAAATSLAAGVITGGIGKVSGRVANKLGLPDVETAMAGGGLQKSGLPWYKRIPSAAAQEGLLQEFPQSAQEQIWQNLAEGKPWYENALRQGVEGALAGGGIGGGAGLLAGRQESNPTEQPEPTTIAGLLPAPTSTGTPSEQVLQAEVARQNAVDAAQANADRIYAERDLYEETMKSVFPYGVPTITEPVAPIQQRIDELLGVERTKLKGLKRAQYQRELKKAYDEPVGITHDANGLEIPLTMGDLLNSQATVEITLREKRQQAIDNANAQAMARNDQVISEETTQQPDPIPVVGSLSAIANQAVKTGVAAQVQAQKAAAENPNGELTQNTADAQVATPSAPTQGSDVPGGGSILEPASTGVADSSGNSSEVAQPSLRADVAAGDVGAPSVGNTSEIGVRSDSSLNRDSSWVLRNKETGEVVMETFDKKKVDALNTEKYEAIPIQEYLGSLNSSIKNQGTADVQKAAQAFEAASERPEQQPAAPVVRGYPQGQARMLAGRLTKQGFPSEIYPHPTMPGMFAIGIAGENNAESTPSVKLAESNTTQDGRTISIATGDGKQNSVMTYPQFSEWVKKSFNGFTNQPVMRTGKGDKGLNRHLKQVQQHANVATALRNIGFSVSGFVPSTPSDSEISKVFNEFYTKGETNGQESASPAPALTAPVAPQRTIPPNQRRDDLVGAILRVTGGAGVASSIADTIVGEKANKVGKLRGLFTNAGQQDLDDLAMLLREQEGYDVRDGSHLEELIRAAASGDVPKSMARQEADAEAAKEKRYRDEIRAKAKKYGIKTVAVKFSELEQRVFETLEQRHKKALELLDAQSKERFNAALEAATSTIPEEVVDETLAEVSRRGLHARDFWNEATRILRGMIYDATQETSNAEQPTENGNAQGDGRGDQGTGRGIAADQGDQAQPGQAETEEVAPTLELAGQTPAEVRAQEAKRKADEEAAKREEKPKTPNVTVDQVDLFNTQGGLFDGKQSESTAKNKDISTGFANVAQRQINAANNFIDSVVDQFGLTKDEAGRAWDYFVANKLVKVDSVGGQYMLSDGRLWDSVAMHRAANNGEDASTIDAASHEAATSPLNDTQGGLFDGKQAAPIVPEPADRTQAKVEIKSLEPFEIDLGSMFGKMKYRPQNIPDIPDGHALVDSSVVVRKTAIRKSDSESYNLPRTVFAWRVSSVLNRDGSPYSMIEAMTSDFGRTENGEVKAYFTKLDSHAADALGRIAPSIESKAVQMFQMVSRGQRSMFSEPQESADLPRVDTASAPVASTEQAQPSIVAPTTNVQRTLPDRIAAAKQKKADENAERAAKFAELRAKRKAEKEAAPNPSGPAESKPNQENAVAVDESVLTDMQLLRKWGDKWQYKFVIGSNWMTANTKEDAVERATKTYYKTPVEERLTSAQRFDKANADEFAQMSQRYGNLSLAELRAKYDELGGDIESLQRSGAREMNGNGGRRTSAAVSAQGSRETAEERMRLGRYIEAHESAEPNSAPVVEKAQPAMLPEWDSFADFWNGMLDGKASITDLKEAFSTLTERADEFRASIAKLKNDQLKRMLGWSARPDDKKADLVSKVYEQTLARFTLNKETPAKQWTFGEKTDVVEKRYQDQLRAVVDGLTDTDLKQFVDSIAESNKAKKAALEEKKAAVADPKTLEDFNLYATYSRNTGKTPAEARKALTPEQRAMWDSLAAEKSRTERLSRAGAQKTEVSVAAVTTEGQIIETKHTKTGQDLFVVKAAERVDRDVYNQWNATAKRLGGWYSSFRGNGAVPGFQFKTREGADAFLKFLGGDVEQSKEVVQERRDAYADDRRQSAVERLNEMADRLEESALEDLGRERKVNTNRRAGMAARAEAAARSQEALAKTMRNIAKAIESGTAKMLDKVRQKTQVEMLREFVRNAKDSEARAQDPNNWYTKELYKEPATADTAEFAQWPTYSADRSDLANLARRMIETDGTRKLGQQLLKIADDVTDVYKKFAKENLHKVSVFSASREGSSEKTQAVFPTADAAERAIARSGFKGKVTTISFKRGEHLVIMGPTMAKEAGIWDGDDSKRITLDPDSGSALVEALGRKRGAPEVPWQFQNTYDKRKKLAAMGIETPAEFRTALREFIGLREAPKEADKVKELERAMVGRKNDGLDFFPTPEGIAQEMIDAAEIKEGMSVLEPSAGMGHIAEKIRDSGIEPDVVEMANDRKELLEAKGFNVVGRDFMDVGDTYDRIIMNPPFSDRRDAQHVQHAYDLLKPGGRLVAIMGEGVFFGQDKKAVAFRDWLEEVGGTSERLPEGSFLDPSLPVNTGVNARMVVIDKPAGQVSPIENESAFSSNSRTTKMSPSDKAVYGIAAEGKSATEILKFIASASRNPFNRQLAKLLQQTGINPAVTVDEAKNWRAQGGKIKDVAAFSQSRNVVALFRPSSAEQNVLHELMHSATLKALSKKGMAAAQMNALFKHVRSTGKLHGMYGMSNVDEFVAEAFTNPKFQQALKKVKAPQGGTLQSAWHWFVRVVRGILGLKQGDESALSAALEIGVGVMRENMGLQSNVSDIKYSYGLPAKQPINLPIDGARLKTLRGLAAGIERPKDGIFLRVTDNGDAIATGQKGQRIPDSFRRFAEDNGLTFKAERRLPNYTGGRQASTMDVGITPKSEPMPIAYRESGAMYFGEATDGALDRTDKTRFNVGTADKSKVRQIDTPEFRAWFGDSKVVDSDGKPLVVYHGTNAKFTSFNDAKIGTGADAELSGLGMIGKGFYFTPHRAEANKFGKRTVAAYVALKNPLIVPPYESARKFASVILGKDVKRGSMQEELAAAGYDGVIKQDPWTPEYVAFHPEQIKSAIGNNGDFDPNNPDIRYNVADDGLDIGKIVGDSGRDYDQRQRQFFKNVGRDVTPQNVVDRARDYLKNDLWKKMAVGVVDQFRGLRDLGDNGQAYMLARLSKGTAGAFETLLHHGKLSIKDGVYDGDKSGGFIEKLGVPLQGELDDFLWYVAANRAEGLAASDRENLFTKDDIVAGKSLAGGMTSFDYTIQTGASKGSVTRSRAFIYADALRVFNEFQKNALDMAEQSGLIDGSSRKYWESEFYVPFYRVSEEDGEFIGSKMGNSLVRQTAFKKLKGGTDKLNSDLLSNTLLNWSHLIEASAKNRAAKAALSAADAVGAAQRVAPDMTSYSASNGTMLPPGTKNAVWFQENGKKVEYLVSDPFVMTAITSLEYAGMRNGVMDVMTKFKHWLTIGVTASPAFKVRNLIRDSVQAIGTSGLSYNPIKNIAEGYAQTKRDSQAYVSALASGGLIRFGTMLEGSESSRVRQLIRSGVKDSTILDSEPKWRQFYNKYLEPGVSAYNELGNRSEEINRAALYNQLIKQGKSHAEAALLARDLMDFSMQGSFNTIRFLTQVVPFMNARLQGLYKLGRSSKDNPRKMAVVTGAVALASIALMLGYDDDDDWKRREDWDRDNFWWFKFGGVEFRIPKPFEIGAVATLAERSVEFMINDEMTGERFRKVTKDLVMNNLSMNPVPQALKPIVDLYANKDSFTGRPIETMSMQRLDPTMRYGSNTSLVARGLSTATGGAASPVQYDHLVRAYFGWLGSFVIGGADMAARPFSNEPQKPEADYWKLATQGIAKEQGSGNSRYLTLVYDQASELEQAHATHRQMIKEGKIEEAQDYAEDNADKLKRYRVVESVKRAESKFNENIRAVERSDLDPAEKKLRIERIQKMKENIAKRIAPGIQGP